MHESLESNMTPEISPETFLSMETDTLKNPEYPEDTHLLENALETITRHIEKAESDSRIN